MPLPLEGIRVLDLSARMPGPVCTQMLGDLGAEVIKIESPRAPDFFRGLPPDVGGTGSPFHICNRNKKGITLELRHPRGREIFLLLVRGADVVVEAFRPGTMERMGLGYETLKEKNTGLVYCALTAFGQDGPYRLRPAHDLNLLALAGVLDLLGTKDGPPVVPPVQMSGLGGAFQAVVGILSALLSRLRDGKGQFIDVSLLDGVCAFGSLEMSRCMAGYHVPKRGMTEGGGGYACFNVYPTADGRYLSLGCLEPHFWGNFCRAIGMESLIGEQWAAWPRQGEMIAEVGAVIASRPIDEWLGLFDPEKICAAPVNTFEEALEDPHIRDSETWFTGELPGGGRVPQVGLPIRFGGNRPGWRSHPPGHGEHTREILESLGIDAGTADELKGLGVI